MCILQLWVLLCLWKKLKYIRFRFFREKCTTSVLKRRQPFAVKLCERLCELRVIKRKDKENDEYFHCPPSHTYHRTLSAVMDFTYLTIPKLKQWFLMSLCSLLCFSPWRVSITTLKFSKHKRKHEKKIQQDWEFVMINALFSACTHQLAFQSQPFNNVATRDMNLLIINLDQLSWACDLCTACRPLHNVYRNTVAILPDCQISHSKTLYLSL